jgi:hypothetical protein
MRTGFVPFLAGGLAIVVACTPVEPAQKPVPAADARPVTDADFTSMGLGTEHTLVVVLAPACAPCDAALPFYKRLMERPAIDGTRRRVVVVGHGVVPIRKALEAAGVYPHAVTSGPDGFVASIGEFPTLILVDAHGTRQKSWTGPLSPEGERDVIAALER